MRRYLLLVVVLFIGKMVKAQDFVIDDFEGEKTSYIVTAGGGEAGGALGVVTDDPTGGTNKALRVQTLSTAYPEFSVKLPEGKTLKDYRGISMDTYVIDRGGGWNALLFMGQWEEGDAPSRNSTRSMLKDNQGRYGGAGTLHTWVTITVEFDKMSGGGTSPMTDADYAMNEFKILFGYGFSDFARYIIRNLKLIE